LNFDVDILLNCTDNTSVEAASRLDVGWQQADDGVAGIIYRGVGHVLPLVVI
jgi:hypothetical protein